MTQQIVALLTVCVATMSLNSCATGELAGANHESCDSTGCEVAQTPEFIPPPGKYTGALESRS